MSNKSITIKALKTEVTTERWDQPAVPIGTRVKARDVEGREYRVTGFHEDRDALVLAVEAVAVADYDIEQPEEP